MSHPTKRRWRPQISLRAFLLLCVLVGGTVGILAQSYHQYVSEQRLITKIRDRMSGNSLTVTTNGDEAYIAGSPFM